MKPAVMCALVPPVPPPDLGQVWLGQGGIYAGLVRDAQGGPDYYLIIGPEAPKKLTWKAGNDWAAALDVEGRSDFALPNRPEASVARANARECFQDAWYWLREPHASDSYYAWGQYFGDGGQSYWSKDGPLRVRAVRRSPIQ